MPQKFQHRGWKYLIFGGVRLGCLYNPGGGDPGLSFLHWLQVIGSTDKSFLDRNSIVSDNGSSFGIPLQAGPNGAPYYWGIDLLNPGTFLRCDYDSSYEGKAAPFANPSYFEDHPKAAPDKSKSIVFLLFKMFYVTFLTGGAITAPAPTDFGIYPEIMRQGIFYAFTLDVPGLPIAP